MSLCGARVYGLGYDAVLNDYKLVRISQFIRCDYAAFESEVRVYSLKTNEWKQIDDMPYVLRYTRKMGVLVSGCVHWVVARTDDLELEHDNDILVGFNLGKEAFDEVPLPEMDRRCQMDVEHLEGCLCIVAKYEDEGVDVWSMKEYRVKESWCKLFTVKRGHGVVRLKSIRPLVYSKNGRQVLLEQNHKSMVWFDLDNQMVKSVMVRGLPDLFETTVCVETLVSVDPSRRDEEKEGNKNKKRDDFLAVGFKLVL